jgi:hypothetical protein
MTATTEQLTDQHTIRRLGGWPCVNGFIGLSRRRQPPTARRAPQCQQHRAGVIAVPFVNSRHLWAWCASTLPDQPPEPLPADLSVDEAGVNWSRNRPRRTSAARLAHAGHRHPHHGVAI